MSIIRHREIEKVSAVDPDPPADGLGVAIQAFVEACVEYAGQTRVNSKSVECRPELEELARDLSIMELLGDMRFESRNGTNHDVRDVAAGVQATFEILGLTWPEPPTRDEIAAWLLKHDYEPADWEY
jgi:hypothetical protein